jgi:hypothetical protein
MTFKDSKAGTIDDRTIRRVRSIPGVTMIYPIMRVLVPMQCRISFMGHRYRIDILGAGLPYSLIDKEIKGKEYKKSWKKPDIERDLPVLLPRAILDTYNNGMADKNRFKRFTEPELIGFPFDVVYGRSSIMSLDNPITIRSQVAGLTGAVDILALLIPIDAVEAINKKVLGDSYKREYLNLLIKVKDHESMTRTIAAIKKMGFIIESGKAVSRQIIELKERVGGIVAYLKYLVMALCVVAIAFSTLISTLNRLEYYRILRILGGSKVFISLSVVLKYALLGSIGAFVGMQALIYFSQQIQGFLHVYAPGITLAVSAEIKRRIIFYGVAIPVLSTLPAIIRLNIKGLNTD